MPRLKTPFSLALVLLLSGCKSEVLMPSGYIAEELRDVLLITTLLTFLIVGPVMAAVVFIAHKYRAGKGTGQYDKHFHHSTQLELLIWSAPLLIIIWLGALTWVSTHKLDPYRPLDAEATGVSKDEKVLNVQVVSMDWKWLFFYPEYGIAVVNEAAAPVDRPIRFDLTSTEVMNAFYVPAVAGMIYTMPSMETQLHAVVNKEGDFLGQSSHYSGAGFSQMKFRFYGLSDGDFDAWIEKVRSEGQPLTREEYLDLELPSIADPVRYYTIADEKLYHDILNRCVKEGQVCIDAQMQHTSSSGHADAAHAEGSDHEVVAGSDKGSDDGGDVSSGMQDI